LEKVPLIMEMPQYGCVHLSQDSVAKIQRTRQSHAEELEQTLAVYFCTQCPISGNILSIDRHISKTKHEFATNHKSVYCGQCKDLVYEPYQLPANTKKRKHSEATEDESLLAANTAQKPCGREGVRGLFNLGETCYMNAVLQMMVHNQLLSSYFLGSGHPIHTCPISKEPEKKYDSESDDEDDDEPKPEHKMCVACSMTELFADSRTSELSIPAYAVNVLYASWKAIPVCA
jgi:ubiquitin carboxyl-terminal hydrolase 22/27/51